MTIISLPVGHELFGIKPISPSVGQSGSQYSGVPNLEEFFRITMNNNDSLLPYLHNIVYYSVTSYGNKDLIAKQRQNSYCVYLYFAGLCAYLSAF